jgi:hypothetical protein
MLFRNKQINAGKTTTYVVDGMLVNVNYDTLDTCTTVDNFHNRYGGLIGPDGIVWEREPSAEQRELGNALVEGSKKYIYISVWIDEQLNGELYRILDRYEEVLVDSSDNHYIKQTITTMIDEAIGAAV